MDSKRMKAIKDILKDSDRLLDLGDIEGHKEKLDELSMHGHLGYMINTIGDQQATIDSLSMAHDAIHREIPKDKHTLIKNIIGLNKRVQELEDVLDQDHRQDVIEGMYEDNERLKERVQELEQWVFETKPYIKSLEQQNERYREAMIEARDVSSCCGATAGSILEQALESESE